MHTRFKHQSVASFTCPLMLLFYSWSSNLKAPDLTITPLTNIQHKFWVYIVMQINTLSLLMLNCALD